MLEEFCPEVTGALDAYYADFEASMPFDRKTYQLMCFALAVKSRSEPCVRKHFREALEEGATVRELSYTLALVMRESSGADDCWVHHVLGDWRRTVEDGAGCGCGCDGGR